jgi:2-aminoethylphosphonate-pyruvate transaminase
MQDELDPSPYFLTTPGPVSTTLRVRRAQLRNQDPWDADFRALTTRLRHRIVALATRTLPAEMIPMQGCGTFAVESLVGSVLPESARILVLNNGAYGARMLRILRRLKIDCVEKVSPQELPVDPAIVETTLRDDPKITHVALVHCETTTGVLNPLAEVGRIAREFGKLYVVDGVSSFGGIPYTLEEANIDFLVSTANKCLQGVPGLAFAVVRREPFLATRGCARSYSLDLHDQWQHMEENNSKFRFTPPTTTILALSEALDELDAEGGIAARHARYQANHEVVVRGLAEAGYEPLVPAGSRSPIVTAFRFPTHSGWTFDGLYAALRGAGFTLYPGSISKAEAFRIGMIGSGTPAVFEKLVAAAQTYSRSIGLT